MYGRRPIFVETGNSISELAYIFLSGAANQTPPMEDDDAIPNHTHTQCHHARGLPRKRQSPARVLLNDSSFLEDHRSKFDRKKEPLFPFAKSCTDVTAKTNKADFPVFPPPPCRRRHPSQSNAVSALQHTQQHHAPFPLYFNSLFMPSPVPWRLRACRSGIRS